MDGGFTIYYLSIQIGGIAPTIVGGFLVRIVGWNLTFGVAMVGMVIGFFTFFLARKKFAKLDTEVGYQKVSALVISLLVVGIIAAVALAAFLLQHTSVTNFIVWAVVMVVLAYVALKARSLNTIDRIRLVIAVVLSALGGVIFFALYYQQPMSLTLFIDRNVEHHFLGVTWPSSTYWVLNPIWILAVGPALSWFYGILSDKNRDPSIMMKFGIGFVAMGIGYFIIVVGTWFADSTQHISSWWIVLSYAFQSTAELLINALGTAMIAKLVHQSLLNVMMGVWFLGTSLGGLVAGSFANFTIIPAHATPLDTLHIYAHAFSIFTYISVIIGIVLCVSTPWVMRLVPKESAAV